MTVLSTRKWARTTSAQNAEREAESILRSSYPERLQIAADRMDEVDPLRALHMRACQNISDAINIVYGHSSVLIEDARPLKATRQHRGVYPASEPIMLRLTPPLNYPIPLLIENRAYNITPYGHAEAELLIHSKNHGSLHESDRLPGTPNVLTHDLPYTTGACTLVLTRRRWPSMPHVTGEVNPDGLGEFDISLWALRETLTRWRESNRDWHDFLGLRLRPHQAEELSRWTNCLTGTESKVKITAGIVESARRQTVLQLEHQRPGDMTSRIRVFAHRN